MREKAGPFREKNDAVNPLYTCRSSLLLSSLPPFLPSDPLLVSPPCFCFSSSFIAIHFLLFIIVSPFPFVPPLSGTPLFLLYPISRLSFSFHPTAAFPTPAVAVVVVVAAAVAVVVIGHTTAVIVVVVPDVILIAAAAFLLLLTLISSSLLSLRHTGKSLLTHASKRTRTCTSSCNTSADPHSSHYIDAHDTTSVRCATYPLHTDFHS